MQVGQNVVEFRRKLLDYDHDFGSVYPPYDQPSIPRYYSSFFGNWRPEYTNLKPLEPEWYNVKFPMDTCTSYTKTLINFKWWVIVVMILLVWWLLRK